MAGRYAPHDGNMWASARIRPSPRARPSARPPAPAPLSTGGPVERWLRTRGSPGALRLLRRLGAFSPPDAPPPPTAATAAPPPPRAWSTWDAALHLSFWMFFAALFALRQLRALRDGLLVRVRRIRRARALRARLGLCGTYAEWAATAAALDAAEERTLAGGRHPASAPPAGEKATPAMHAAAAVCDTEMLRGKLAELARLHEKGDIGGLAFALRASLQRNYAGICHPGLSSHTRVGTARIVEDYVSVVSYLLAYIAQSETARPPRHGMGNTLPHKSASDLTRLEVAPSVDSPPPGPAEDVKLLSVESKLVMFNEARIAYGRTALMLSGGASMGIHHLGVVKALLDQNLMPKVVCGTSAGALVGSIVGIFEDRELANIISSDDLQNPLTGTPFSFRYFDDSSSYWRRLRRFLRTGVIQDVRMLQDCLRRNYGDITFQEAYIRTRRILNITVCAGRSSSDPPMLLNYLTAPHVLVWSAASASCALPFVFAPVELVAKGYDGRMVPYHPHGVRWIDGSITSDIPLARIGELFNVNHFIVSQTNPHVIPRGMPLFKTRLAMLLLSELQFRYWQLLQLGLVPRLISTVFPHFMQPYEGDITIMPEVSLSDIMRLLVNPTVPMVKSCIERGERQTFPFLERIRRQCIIEQVLDASVEQVARASAKPVGASGDGTLTPTIDGAQRPLKRGNSFFGRVPSWLWLDPSSLLSSGSVSAVASRIPGLGSASSSSTALPSNGREKDAEGTDVVSQESPRPSRPMPSDAPGHVKDAQGGTKPAEAGADGVKSKPGESSLAWANRLYRQPMPRECKGSPLLEKVRHDPEITDPMTELEHMWLEFGVAARAERANVEPSEAGDNDDTRSQGSSTEEERIMC